MREEIGGAAGLRQRALELVRSALIIIDEAGGPADVGAHLGLAICRLETALTTGA